MVHVRLIDSGAYLAGHRDMQPPSLYVRSSGGYYSMLAEHWGMVSGVTVHGARSLKDSAGKEWRADDGAR